VLVVAAAVAGGWYVYTKVQDQLAATKPVAVPFVEGTKEVLAVENIRNAGLHPVIARQPDDKVPETFVISQDPSAGTRTDKGNPVRIVVSTGLPKVNVPGVVGDQATDAVAALTERGLKARIHHVNSDKETGTVTGQDPAAGERVLKGTGVRINVSDGPKPIAIPPVVGVPYEQAAAQLQGAGFAVARRDVDSNDPKGTVVQQDPAANSLDSKGATVTLYVSKGPTQSAVPDVSSFSRTDAIATLRNSGFKVVVEESDVQDPSLDGVVLFQAPQAGSSAEPGATVTITVGHYTAPPPPTTTETVPTDTVPTDTTGADTTLTDTTPVP
jgi:serine/threonine-protein kinase